METMGLIAAMPQESAALLRRIENWKRTALGPFRGARFRLAHRDCLLVTTGMGLQRAMDGTRTLLAVTTPHLLISFGIAGTVYDNLHIGDVVVARSAWLLDMGLPGQSWPLASLSEAGWNAAAQVLQPDGARLVAGTAITARGSQVAPQSAEKMSHPILEMETSGIAQVAAERGIPLVSIRSVSDGPQAPIPFDLEAVMDEKYNLRIGKLLMMVLRSPQIILRLRRTMLNSGKAADHAAKALVALLSQPSPVISPPDREIRSPAQILLGGVSLAGSAVSETRL
jgi:adenosylhomocysteine nucleosidase